MKKLLLLGALVAGLVLPFSASAAVWVDGYFKNNGTYVSGHYRSEPNGLKYDNYSWTDGDDLYNDSYYSSGYDSTWYTPSYSWDTDYYTGYNYNNYYLDSDFDNSYVDDWYYDSSDWYSNSYDSYDWYDSAYDW